MSAATPQILGDKYRLVRPLDNGGMGSVWLAEHLALASPVAIKLITAEVAKTAERLQRFMREARAAAAARSPHVVQVLDYGVHDGTPYIVMELLEGESLADRLQRRGHIGPSETETVIRHVSRAISRAHEAGIVHRDLKPANIFITHNEEEEIIKVFDFGIAKAGEAFGGPAGGGSSAVGAGLGVAAGAGLSGAGWGGGLGKATRTGVLLGTPYYMSPEQLEGRRRCDHRADIWAMGVIAFECLLGRLPFNGRGIGGLVLSVCSHPLPVPSRLAVVPEGFDAWFARACCRPLEGRFASAREAALELRNVLGVAQGAGLDPSRAPDPSRVVDAARAASGGETPARLALSSGIELESMFERRVRGGTVAIGFPRFTSPERAAAAASAGEVSAPAALPSTTADPSSATLDREHARRLPHPLALAAPVVACVAIALALQWGRGSAAHEPGSASSGSSEVASSAHVAAAAPESTSASLIVLARGAGLRASVDGQDIGPVPCEVQNVAPGEHTVVISGDARYRPSHTRVHLEPGGVATVGPVDLEVDRGLATVVAGEGAEGAALSLSIGDSTRPVSSLPVQLDVETAQLHVLHAEKPGFAPYHQRLSFEDGQSEKTFAVTLARLPEGEPAATGEPGTKTEAKKPAKGKGRRPAARRGRARPPRSTQAEGASEAAQSTFTFTATPEASVLLDGAPLGSTPLHDVSVEPGSHRVIFIHGAQRKAMLVVGVSGRDKVVSASFQPPR